MKKITLISKICIGATVVLLGSWVIPWALNLLLTISYKDSFTLYSPIKKDFIMRVTDESGKYTHKDTKGNYYSQNEADALMPFFFSRQLLADGRWPEEIQGKAYTVRDAQMATFFFQHGASDINKPEIGLYQMLESRSGRVSLESPTDVFRITQSGVEFIDIETNVLLEDKSKRFTKMLNDKGFVFPAKTLHGEPNIKKDYDEGYLILDNEGKLFHVKQVGGRPYVKAIAVPNGLEIQQLFITEFKDQYTLGFATCQNEKLHVITRSDYKFHTIDVDGFNAKEAALFVMGTPVYWTVAVTNEDAKTYYAVDSNTFEIIDRYVTPEPEHNFVYKAKMFLMSWALHFTSGNDGFIKPRFGY